MSYDISLQNKIFLDILMSLLKLYTAVADPEEAGFRPLIKYVSLHAYIYDLPSGVCLFLLEPSTHHHPRPLLQK